MIDWASAHVLLGLTIMAGALMCVEAALVWLGIELYFRLGFRLEPAPLPIVLCPEGQGTTASVVWSVGEEGTVRYWAEHRLSEGLWGLHGSVQFRRRAGRYHWSIRWAPPWTPFAFLIALGVWGLLSARGHVLVPVGAGFALMIFAVYQRAAVRAAAELRWAFVKSEDPT